jgi:hypothetical protein
MAPGRVAMRITTTRVLRAELRVMGAILWKRPLVDRFQYIVK